MDENKMKKIALVVVTMCVMILSGFGFYTVNKDKSTQEIVQEGIEELKEYITTYKMSEQEIKELPSTEIKEQTEEQENATEQATTETEGFELQGKIAYEGDSARNWDVELGDYKGLTYYSQIDSRWSNKMYSSVNDKAQTIGTSGCGPTSASMIVTACKGAITPDKMSDLFVKYGYRSANNGTYWSAFRAVADEFNIEYKETYNLDTVVNLLRNNHYVVASCGNGLFTNGGHFIVLVGIEGNTIKVYDPYLYAGKFNTSTRREKATVNGNTVYVTVDNFRNYANAKGFFAYKHSGEVKTNNTQTVVTSTYTRYVNAKIGLNVRNVPNGARINGLVNGTQVTVAETNGEWSRIVSPMQGWVSSSYLTSTQELNTQVKNTNVASQNFGTYKLKKSCYLYSNSNLTGIRYSYLANTNVTVLQNVNSRVDKIKVNKTGRIAYVDRSNYTNTTTKNTVGQNRMLKACYLYSNSNLGGVKYTYLDNTYVIVLQNVNSNVDRIKVAKTGRIAYVNKNNYK